MAIAKVADRGTSFNSTGGTLSQPVDLPTGGSITVGNYLIARISQSNAGASGAANTPTVTDARNGSWTISAVANQTPGSVANDGATAIIAYIKVASGYSNGDDVTLAWSPAQVGWAVVIEEWSGIHATIPVAASQTTAAFSASPSVASTPASSGQLFYGLLAHENGISTTYTEDADTTNGTWVTLTEAEAIVGGGSATNTTVRGAYKLVTASGAQSWDTTLSANRDWAAVALVFEVAGGHTESFDKADSTTLGPDQTWTEVVSDMEVVGNAARNVTAGTNAVARCELDLTVTDHWAEISLSTWGISADTGSAGVACRYAAAADTCYLFQAGFFFVPFINLVKIVAGTATTLAVQLGVTVAQNDRLAIQCQGSVITGFINGGQALQVVDTAITTGTRVGIHVLRGTEGANIGYLDAFYAPVYGLTTPRIRSLGAPSLAASQASSY